MSRKLTKAANEKDQKSILKYTEVEEDKCTTENKEATDIVAPISTERCTELKDATLHRKEKDHKEIYRTVLKAVNPQNTSKHQKTNQQQQPRFHLHKT